MVQHRYDVYGLTELSLTDARSIIEKALGLELSERGSEYFGGAYYKYRLDSGREAILFSNFIAARADWVRGRHKDYSVLLEVSDLEDMDEIQQRLMASCSGIVLLETSTIDDESESVGES
ncbi:hypothetical protein [Enhygromyxa salina]|uniref:hypothetical protein n=1 Tax=Enhygromyxa salina TaxID=215803 RepID=UPI00069623AC|nr:hypothetical protein [Enhygromyxa salina]